MATAGCARPRAQQAPTLPARPHFPGFVCSWTLLLPGTDALRSCGPSCFALCNASSPVSQSAHVEPTIHIDDFTGAERKQVLSDGSNRFADVFRGTPAFNRREPSLIYFDGYGDH